MPERGLKPAALEAVVRGPFVEVPVALHEAVSLGLPSVFVPNLRPRNESVSTDREHKFRRIGVTTTIRLKLIGNDGPRGGDAARSRSAEPHALR